MSRSPSIRRRTNQTDDVADGLKDLSIHDFSYDMHKIADSFENLSIRDTTYDSHIDQLANQIGGLSVADKLSFKDAMTWFTCLLLVLFISIFTGFVLYADVTPTIKYSSAPTTSNNKQPEYINSPSSPKTSNSKFPIIPKPPSGSSPAKPKKTPRKLDPQRGSGKYVVTHFHLVWIWPPGFCEKSTTCWPEVEVNNFYLHGLWPVSIKGRCKLRCRPLPYDQEDSEEFYRILIEEVVNDLYELYPSFEKTINFGNQVEASPNFWLYEFEKHGVCAQEVGININSYFKMVLDLSKKKLDNAFAEMLQKETTIHTLEDFALALNPIIGERRFYLSCIKDTRLSQLMLCVNLDGQFMDCPSYSRKFGCKEDSVTFQKTWTF